MEILESSLKKTIIEYYRTNDDYNNQMEEFNQVCTSLLIENTVTNPNISKALSIILSPEVANPVFEGEFEYLNDPSSHKFAS